MGVPIRVSLPAGLATVIGALPQLNPFESSKVVRELTPGLPSGPSVDLRTPERLGAGVDAALLAPVRPFLEEPGLANSMHPTFPLSPSEIEGLVAGVVEPLTTDAVMGVQVNGRADWALLLRTGIGVLGAPISARLETAAAELGRFLESGGFVAWGAVPVDEPLGSGVERLWRRLSALWAGLAQAGLDPLRLRERSIITPAAGLGGFGLSQAERVLRLTGELSERVFNQVVGARLSIGA